MEFLLQQTSSLVMSIEKFPRECGFWCLLFFSLETTFQIVPQRKAKNQVISSLAWAKANFQFIVLLSEICQRIRPYLLITLITTRKTQQNNSQIMQIPVLYVVVLYWSRSDLYLGWHALCYPGKNALLLFQIQ